MQTIEALHNEKMLKAIRQLLEGEKLGRNVLCPPDKEVLMEALLTPVIEVKDDTPEELKEVNSAALADDNVICDGAYNPVNEYRVPVDLTFTPKESLPDDTVPNPDTKTEELPQDE